MNLMLTAAVCYTVALLVPRNEPVRLALIVVGFALNIAALIGSGLQ